jgi:hypothetical protein
MNDFIDWFKNEDPFMILIILFMVVSVVGAGIISGVRRFIEEVSYARTAGRLRAEREHRDQPGSDR